ncbi:MAG: C39 family peptidase [Anaerolineales bacterium]|nr:C39 family peptidase [Anaerolineales bacterium]
MDKQRFFGITAILMVAILSCNFLQSGLPINDDANAAPVLLNEILFLPADGQHAFVELKALGNGTSVTGMVLKNERGDSFSIPENSPDLDVDEYLLILFDGVNSVEGNTVHADRLEFLNTEAGFLELYTAENNLLDRVAWGEDQAGTVKLSRGGMILDLEPGLTIGRFPLSTLSHPLEWTIINPDQATPGMSNPQPAVEVMIPLNGAVIKESSFELSWYPAPGATQYQVQVASDDTFGTLTIDETVNEPASNVELQPGKYFWRVQAIAENDERAEFSPVQTLTINLQFSRAHLAMPVQQTTLGVPFIGQHKDTQMILLESKNETGEHAWDVAHPELDRSDPADYGNCALASVAMINAFYGGDLSQDRIGFEVFHDSFPGPEYDLMYGQGLYSSQTSQALAFALEGESLFRQQPDTFDVNVFWADVQLGISAGAPILAAIRPGHAIVITGYYEDTSTRYVFINDPWWGAYAVDIDGYTWKYYWMTSPDSIPTLNDPEISMDSDGDGIMDFDETNRFGTDPNDRDTDKDDLEDKDDLRASIYDEQWGYALSALSYFGRDYDQDGIKMELDEDSDGGGCFDGMEDFDLDGKYKEPETWNFDEKDDACFFGTSELYLEDTSVSEYGTGTIHQILRTLFKFSLRAVEDGTLEGIGQVTYSAMGESYGSTLVPECNGMTYDIGTHHYQVNLGGTFQKLPDGGTFVSFLATPDHGDPFTFQWVGPCPSEGAVESWYWGGGGGTLKDGVYDYYVDMAASSGINGEFWQKIHMEQGQGMP